MANKLAKPPIYWPSTRAPFSQEPKAKTNKLVKRPTYWSSTEARDFACDRLDSLYSAGSIHLTNEAESLARPFC